MFEMGRNGTGTQRDIGCPSASILIVSHSQPQENGTQRYWYLMGLGHTVKDGPVCSGDSGTPKFGFLLTVLLRPKRYISEVPMLKPVAVHNIT